MRREKSILLLFSLVILLILVGNYILNTLTLNDKKYLDAYNKSINQNYTIHIEVDNKTLILFDNEGKKIIKTYKVATGKKESPTPLGTYKITSKGKWGEGFGSRWMGLNVPWGIYGIHGTNKPGSIGFNASGGCIRMRNSDIEELFGKIKEGTTVIITSGYYGPFGYEYRNLRPGARGADVLEVQKRLSYLGYYKGALDGIYGEEMKSSLINYIKDNNIALTDEISPNIFEKLGIILMD